MSLDVKNINAGDTGNSQQGRITVKATKTTYKKVASPDEGKDNYSIDGFDAEGPVLMDRIDDPNYYYPNGI